MDGTLVFHRAGYTTVSCRSVGAISANHAVSTPFNRHYPNPGGIEPSTCIVSSTCSACFLLAAPAARTIFGTSTLLTSPIVVAHLLHLSTLSDRVFVITTTECAIHRLRISPTVRRKPFMTLRYVVCGGGGDVCPARARRALGARLARYLSNNYPDFSPRFTL